MMCGFFWKKKNLFNIQIWTSSSLSLFLTSCLYLRLSSTQPRRSMRRSRRECLISTMRWDALFPLYILPPQPSPSLFFLFFFFRISSPLFQSLFSSFSSVWFSSSVCGLPRSLSPLKGGENPPLCFLWLQPSKTPCVPPFSCSIFHSLSLSLFTPQLSLSLFFSFSRQLASS